MCENGDVCEVFLKEYIGRGHVPEERHFGVRPCLDTSTLALGQVRVRTLYIAMSPSLRFSLNEDSAATCSKGRLEVGAVMRTDGVGIVVESTGTLFKVGDIIANKPHTLSWPWHTMPVFTDNEMFGCMFLVAASGDDCWLRRFPEAAVSYFGISALTSYFGLTEILKPDTSGEKWQTLVVSGASGACGSIAGQIGKIIGFSRVVGITSCLEKAEYLINELHYDHAVVHAGTDSTDIIKALENACPNGIDCYFDNVGGHISEAVANQLNRGGRVAVCGAMSQMAEGGSDQNWTRIVHEREASIKWFRYTSYMDDVDKLSDARQVLQGFAERGQLHLRLAFFEGLQQAPACFVGLFTGAKVGKALVRLA